MYGKIGYKSMCALQWSVILTEPTVSKFPVVPQLLVNNRYTKTGDKITSPAPRIIRQG